MKNIHFLAGFPRSGATLLSSILEQNPEIHSPPASPLINVMLAVHNCYSSSQNIDYDRSIQIYNVLNNVVSSFFADREEKIIIDKNWAWVQKLPSDIIYRHITTDIKFICPVREISEIINSFLHILNTTRKKDNLMDKTVEQLYGEINNDTRSIYIMEKLISENYKVLKERYNAPEFKDSFLLVPYNTTVSNTKEVIGEIYDFLDIPSFKHDFNDIGNNYPNNTQFMDDLHEVRKEISIRDKPNYIKELKEETQQQIFSYNSFWEN